MKEEQFKIAINELFPTCKQETISRWIDYAKECVDLGQVVNFSYQPDREIAVAEWLDTLYAGLYYTEKEYGIEAAQQVCELSSMVCFYPSEMKEVAEFLKHGKDPKEIVNLINTGVIEGNQPFFLR